jgi:ankyrin repeat protein
MNKTREINLSPYNELFEAVDKGDLGSVIKCIKSGIDMNEADPRELIGSGNTPLHHAANCGHVEIVRALIDAGADVNVRCHRGWTPLIRACNAGHYEVAKVLLETSADVNAVNNEGYTAYDRIMMSDERLIKLLESYGAMKKKQTLDYGQDEDA